MDHFDFKKITGPLTASQQVPDMEAVWGSDGASAQVPRPILEAIWGTNGTAAGAPVLDAIWGTNGTAFEDPLFGCDDPTFA